MVKQKGVVLLVALVLLAVMTLGGIAAMNISIVEGRLTTNVAAKEGVFQAAELALSKVEYRLIQPSIVPLDEFEPDLPKFSDEHFRNTCLGINCFDDNCNNGYCFHGNFPVGGNCTGTGVESPWRDPAVWTDELRHGEFQVQLRLNQDDEQLYQLPARYIIEFMCYVKADPDEDWPMVPPPSLDYLEYYRITTLVEDDVTGARAMLQSTLIKPITN